MNNKINRKLSLNMYSYSYSQIITWTQHTQHLFRKFIEFWFDSPFFYLWWAMRICFFIKKNVSFSLQWISMVEITSNDVENVKVSLLSVQRSTVNYCFCIWRYAWWQVLTEAHIYTHRKLKVIFPEIRFGVYFYWHLKWIQTFEFGFLALIFLYPNYSLKSLESMVSITIKFTI